MELAGIESPRRRTAGSSPALADLGLQGSALGSVWLWSIAVACVMHWRPQGGGSGLGRGSPRQGAALRGGARQCAGSEQKEIATAEAN